MQLALQEIESNFEVPSPDPVQKLRGMLSESITRFYPFSVVKVRFARRSEFEDAKNPAEVVTLTRSLAASTAMEANSPRRQTDRLHLSDCLIG